MKYFSRGEVSRLLQAGAFGETEDKVEDLFGRTHPRLGVTGSGVSEISTKSLSLQTEF